MSFKLSYEWTAVKTIKLHHSAEKFFFLVFFFRSPAISLGVTTFGWDFCVCDRFFNPTIKVVTFRLRGWCVLDVFLLPAFTRLRIFWVRVMKCMYAQTRPRFILSSEGVFGGMEFEPMLTPREKIPSTENVPRGGSNPRRCGQRAQALPTELFRPPVEKFKFKLKKFVMKTNKPVIGYNKHC